MSNSSEQFKLYSEKRARKEALNMIEKINSGEASDYNEAETLIEDEKRNKNLDFTKKEDRKRFEELSKDRREKLSNEAHAHALTENERMEIDKEKRAENHSKYGHYKDSVYKVISEVFEEKGLSTRAWRKKILRHHKLPPEAVFIFKKLKSANISINELPSDLLKKVLKRIYNLIDRKNDYDKELAQRIGHSELLRWRNGEELKNEDSFKKIISTLRDYAVVKSPKTKIGQKPRVTFKPKGSYHKDENL